MVTMMIPGGLVVEDGRTEIEHRGRQRLPFGRVRNETRYVGGHLLTPVKVFNLAGFSKSAL